MINGLSILLNGRLGGREMVRIDCWYCKKNLGNQSCELYDFIPKEVFNKCKSFERYTIEECEKKVKDGVNLYFHGVDDPDLI